MKCLHFLYQMSLIFTEPAFNHHFTLKCFPVSDEVQTVERSDVQIYPKNYRFMSCDSFGNQTLCGEVPDPHMSFEITVEGDVITGNAGQTARTVRTAIESDLAKYRYQSKYTKAGQAVKAYHNTIKNSGYGNSNMFGNQKGNSSQGGISPDTMSHRQIAEVYMQALYRDMAYVPGTTGIHTTAEEALTNRQGVCQDYAHILIALLRMDHIPARYVVGLMLGEGASHAWVEVCDEGLWYGIDPTNGKWVDDDYIFISCGRDAYDCQMNKGMLSGGGLQTQKVSVKVVQHI